MIDRNTVDRIMDAVRIEEVIGDFVSLKKKGANYLGLCPFHADKNPSLSVSSTKGIFKCFSCGKAGTAVSFVMDHEHMTYAEALRYLARKYNIEIVEKEETAEEIATRMKYESLLVISDFAQKHFQEVLWNTEEGRNIALSYFRERRFSDETIRQFGLGYASDRRHSLTEAALRKGYKAEYLVAAGLSIERDNGTLADRFYDRVIFPIQSVSGRVIGFGGRTLSKEKSIAKYVNSPQSEIYDKSRTLYGLFQAKGAVSRQDACILVEGYADVISMHQAGINHVVASSGTALTVEQIRLIKRFTSNIILIYDGDEAGIRAALRGTDLILEEGMNVKVVLLPPDEDPDSFARSHPRIEIEEYIEANASDFITFKSDILSREAGSDPIRKARMINDIIHSISVIPDAILRNIYAEAVAGRFEQKADDILSKIASMRGKKREQDRRQRAYRKADMLQEELYEPSWEPVPAGDRSEEEHGPSSDSREEVPEREAASNPYLLAQERELCYLLVKFGFYPLKFDEDCYIGAEKHPDMTVSQYIRAALEEDEIVFSNPLYRTITELYFQFADTVEEGPYEARQETVMRRLQSVENREVVQQCLDFVLDTHVLTIKEYRRSLSPEESRLGSVVPRTVILYKRRIVEQQCMELIRRIAEAQKEGDMEKMREWVSSLQVYNKVKLSLSEELEKYHS